MSRQAQPEPTDAELRARVERADVRILGAFALLTAVLLAPALVRAFTPLDATGVRDAAGVIEAEALEGAQLAGERAGVTATYFAAQTSDLASSADETRLDLLRSDVQPAAVKDRDAVMRLAAATRDALETLSVSAGDPGAIARADVLLRAAAAQLHGLAGP